MRARPRNILIAVIGILVVVGVVWFSNLQDSSRKHQEYSAKVVKVVDPTFFNRGYVVFKTTSGKKVNSENLRNYYDVYPQDFCVDDGVTLLEAEGIWELKTQ